MRRQPASTEGQRGRARAPDKFRADLAQSHGPAAFPNQQESLVSTLNPKVAGSIPARPTHGKCLQTGLSPRRGPTRMPPRPAMGQHALLTSERARPITHQKSLLDLRRASPRTDGRVQFTLSPNVIQTTDGRLARRQLSWIVQPHRSGVACRRPRPPHSGVAGAIRRALPRRGRALRLARRGRLRALTVRPRAGRATRSRAGVASSTASRRCAATCRPLSGWAPSGAPR